MWQHLVFLHDENEQVNKQIVADKKEKGGREKKSEEKRKKKNTIFTTPREKSPKKNT